MALDALVQAAVDSGKWAQCTFCKRALPTVAWKKELEDKEHAQVGLNLGTFAADRMPEVITANGFCTHCVRSGYDNPTLFDVIVMPVEELLAITFHAVDQKKPKSSLRP